MTHIFLGNTKNANRTAAKDQKTTVETQHQSRLVRMKISYAPSFWRQLLTLIYQSFHLTWKIWPPSSSFFERIKKRGVPSISAREKMFQETVAVLKLLLLHKNMPMIRIYIYMMDETRPWCEKSEEFFSSSNCCVNKALFRWKTKWFQELKTKTF